MKHFVNPTYFKFKNKKANTHNTIINNSKDMNDEKKYFPIILNLSNIEISIFIISPLFILYQNNILFAHDHYLLYK